MLAAANLKSLEFTSERKEKMATTILEKLEIYANLAEHLNVEAEISRNELSLRKLEKEIERLENKLSNPQFLEKAPPNVREGEEAKLKTAKEQKTKLASTIIELKALR